MRRLLGPVDALAPLLGSMVSSGPGIMSSIPGSVVGAVVGMVVGAVVGAVVGLVVGAAVVGATVVTGWVCAGFFLRQPARQKTVRTRARIRHKYFFMVKPPDLSDSRASISRSAGFTRIFFSPPKEKSGNFVKKIKLPIAIFKLVEYNVHELL